MNQAELRRLTSWRPPRETLESGIGTWVGLFAAVLLLLRPGSPPPLVIGCLVGITCLLMAALRWRIGLIAVVALLATGLALRAAGGPTGSDVLTVVRAAMELVLAGGNPYGHGFVESRPPGAPYAYGPLALVWYLPVRTDPQRMEQLISYAILGLLAARGRVLGLAVFATLPALVSIASDGSNDTSASLLILVALLLAVRSPWLGTFALAVAAAFKLYALAWLPPLLVYGGLTTAIPFLVGTLLTWGPAVLLYDARNIVTSLQQAEAIHDNPFYSLASVAEHLGLPRTVFDVGRFAAGGLLALSSWVFVRSARSFMVVGIAIFLATLFLGWWSTYAYFAAIAPLICWHIDDWLGLPHVAWPLDPVGRFTEWVDRRWPVRSSAPWRLRGTPEVSSEAIQP